MICRAPLQPFREKPESVEDGVKYVYFTLRVQLPRPRSMGNKYTALCWQNCDEADSSLNSR
jgi:hypothetical protein